MLVSRTTRAATLLHNFSALLKQTIPLELVGSLLDLRDSKQNDFN
jgi:hypothetical protein